MNDYYEECYLDAIETFHNTTDRTFYRKCYRIWLSRYGGNTVSCPICPAHGGENYTGKYKIGRSWKTYRNYQCKNMAVRDSIRQVIDTVDDSDEFFENNMLELAGMEKSANSEDLKSSARKGLRVRPPLSAPSD